MSYSFFCCFSSLLLLVFLSLYIYIRIQSGYCCLSNIQTKIVQLPTRRHTVSSVWLTRPNRQFTEPIVIARARSLVSNHRTSNVTIFIIVHLILFYLYIINAYHHRVCYIYIRMPLYVLFTVLNVMWNTIDHLEWFFFLSVFSPGIVPPL